MLKRLLAATAGLAIAVIATAASGQTNVDNQTVRGNLRLPQKTGLPRQVASALQDMLLSVGCPDWNRVDGEWGQSSADQFTAYLSKTGQTKIYEKMTQPSVGKIRDDLFINWDRPKDFDETNRTDLKYCWPLGRDVQLKADMRLNQWTERNIELPNGLPVAIAKQAQNWLESVGCPDRTDESRTGKWGPSSAAQFESFLQKTEQLDEYERLLARAASVEEIRELFDDYAPEEGLIPTGDGSAQYCYPQLGGGEDEDKKTIVGVDLRAPQTTVKLPVYIAKQLQRLLVAVGCPDWGKDDGKWYSSSAGQFRRFLTKTGQMQKYEAVTAATLYDIKQFFSGWVPRTDFDHTRNDKPQYCEPVPRCDLNKAVSAILDENENYAIKELFLNLRAWNKDIPRQRSIQGRVVSAEDENQLNAVRDKLIETEGALRDLFRRAAEIRHLNTCGQCTTKVNYERALLAGLSNITRRVVEKYRPIWKDIEVTIKSITSKEKLIQEKERNILTLQTLKLNKRGNAETLDNLIKAEKVAVDEIERTLTEEKVSLDRMLKPIQADIKSEVGGSNKPFRKEMQLTTCFVGDGPYVIE